MRHVGVAFWGRRPMVHRDAKSMTSHSGYEPEFHVGCDSDQWGRAYYRVKHVASPVLHSGDIVHHIDGRHDFGID